MDNINSKNIDFNEQSVEVLQKKLKKSKRLNIILLIISIISLLILLSITVFALLFVKGNKQYFNGILGKNFNLASVSQISTENKIDIEKFANKLAFIDDVINLMYYYDKDNKKVEDGMFKGYLNSLGDKYAEYLPAKEFEEFTEKNTEGIYYGIGCMIRQDEQTKDCIVTSVYENSPAEKGGVQIDDIFLTIDGENVRGMNASEIADRIKGEEGTKREIEVFRKSINENVNLTVYTGKVEIKLVTTEIYEDGIGYLDLDEFTGKASEQFKTAINRLISSNIKGLIIDLRDNPGGELITVCEMIDYMLKDRDGLYTLNQENVIFDEGKTLLVYIKEKDVIVDAAYADDNHSVELPIVILTNNYTASAAELFTGALRDYNKAEVVGIKTYGKGVVQNMIPYEDGSAIKFTVSEYFPPSGYSIDKVGIIPDYSLDYAGVEIKYNEDKNIVEVDDRVEYVFDRDGNIIKESVLDKTATKSDIEKSSSNHIENLKIYDENNKFLTEDWFIELDDKYDDKQLLQAIIVLKDKIK